MEPRRSPRTNKPSPTALPISSSPPYTPQLDADQQKKPAKSRQEDDDNGRGMESLSRQLSEVRVSDASLFTTPIKNQQASASTSPSLSGTLSVPPPSPSPFSPTPSSASPTKGILKHNFRMKLVSVPSPVSAAPDSGIAASTVFGTGKDNAQIQQRQQVIAEYAQNSSATSSTSPSGSSSSSSSSSSSLSSASSRKSPSFSDVHVYYFDREYSDLVVPGEGTTALGLSAHDDASMRETMAIDAFQTRQMAAGHVPRRYPNPCSRSSSSSEDADKQKEREKELLPKLSPAERLRLLKACQVKKPSPASPPSSSVPPSRSKQQGSPDRTPVRQGRGAGGKEELADGEDSLCTSEEILKSRRRHFCSCYKKEKGGKQQPCLPATCECAANGVGCHVEENGVFTCECACAKEYKRDQSSQHVNPYGFYYFDKKRVSKHAALLMHLQSQYYQKQQQQQQQQQLEKLTE